MPVGRAGSILLAVLWLMLDFTVPPLIWPTVLATLLTVISGFIYLMDGIRQVQRGSTPAPNP